ncbi:MAG: SDR family oxidoreductase [Sediminibacterium sp.]|nr:SDR family oxidoreductase [Sediminibacterium sp.]
MKNVSSVEINLSGKTALITGGTRGIGKAIAQCLLAAGATVMVTGTKINEIEKLNAENVSDRIQYLQVDFSSESSISTFLEHIGKQSVIDILVNNAGVNRINLNTETSSGDYDFLNNINLKAPYLISREVSRLMKKNNYGRIVNITSIWSTITRPGRSLYALTKWGMVGLTKTLSVELAENNILVNAVGPGFTMTELTASTNTPEEIEKISAMIPMKRMAQPVEIANLVLFLCSDLNSYLTGQNIIIDGGYTNV